MLTSEKNPAGRPFCVCVGGGGEQVTLVVWGNMTQIPHGDQVASTLDT